MNILTSDKFMTNVVSVTEVYTSDSFDSEIRMTYTGLGHLDDAPDDVSCEARAILAAWIGTYLEKCPNKYSDENGQYLMKCHFEISGDYLVAKVFTERNPLQIFFFHLEI